LTAAARAVVIGAGIGGLAAAVRNTTARVLGKLAPGALLRGLGPIYDWRPGESGR
jgi:hypothetical protein